MQRNLRGVNKQINEGIRATKESRGEKERQREKKQRQRRLRTTTKNGDIETT